MRCRSESCQNKRKQLRSNSSDTCTRGSLFRVSGTSENTTRTKAYEWERIRKWMSVIVYDSTLFILKSLFARVCCECIPITMIILPEPEIHRNRRHIQVPRDRNRLPGRLVLHSVPLLRSMPSYLLLLKH